MSVVMLKIGVQIDGCAYSASIDSVFGSIPLSEISDLEGAMHDAVHQLDFDGEEMINCEGYAELIFKMEPEHNPNTSAFDRFYCLVDSYYQPLI